MLFEFIVLNAIIFKHMLLPRGRNPGNMIAGTGQEQQQNASSNPTSNYTSRDKWWSNQINHSCSFMHSWDEPELSTNEQREKSRSSETGTKTWQYCLEVGHLGYTYANYYAGTLADYLIPNRLIGYY